MFAKPVERWKLPKRLREVSGLTLSGDDRLFAVADERAIVFELDYRSGRVRKKFNVGTPVLHADIEGMAAHGSQLYLVTSDAMLIQTKEAVDGNHATFTSTRLELPEPCEVEGLTAAPATGTRGNALWIACKRLLDGRRDASLRLYRLALPNHQLEALDLELTPILAQIYKKRFNPSGIAFTPDGSKMVIIAARQAAYAIFNWSANPTLNRAGLFADQAAHPQVEGIAIDASGAVLLADEGGKRKGRLSRYESLAALGTVQVDTQ